MVKNSIKVFARVKRECNTRETGSYQISQQKNSYEDIIFYNNYATENYKPRVFRFHKIFDQFSKQADVFETVAKSVINSVIEGFNGTIFAYGQTGSGKTYSITGSPKNYEDRGIIPRSIQHIFSHLEQIPSENYTIHISYMEIYNEIGYDLLSPKQQKTAMRLEELPRVILLDDGKGEAHIRNLSVLPVTTEQDAMRLLFLGDTNRTIAETPMNEYSSRSHCIFTIYVSVRCGVKNISRFSKLHLVDLAGSERVSKNRTTGMALTEAKSINLSLHYLEQVILALSEEKRPHIPYRNSLMTYMLKDSLSGNCLTLMLATFSVNKKNIAESISTCKFAQRVALVKIDAIINEATDSQHQVCYLQKRINELEKEISYMTGNMIKGELTQAEKDNCQKEMEKFLHDGLQNEDVKIGLDMRQVQFCFKIIRKEVEKLRDLNSVQNSLASQTLVELNDVKDVVKKKDEEINYLKIQVDEASKKTSMQRSSPNCSLSSEQSTDNNYLLKQFMSHSENPEEINYYTETLKSKYEMARTYADTIDQCQTVIIGIRKKTELAQSDEEKNKLQFELRHYQEIYRKAIVNLKELKNETDHLKFGQERAEIILKQKYEIWMKENARKQKNHYTRSNSAHSNLYYDQKFTHSNKVLKEENAIGFSVKDGSACIPNQNYLDHPDLNRNTYEVTNKNSQSYSYNTVGKQEALNPNVTRDAYEVTNRSNELFSYNNMRKQESSNNNAMIHQHSKLKENTDVKQLQKYVSHGRTSSNANLNQTKSYSYVCEYGRDHGKNCKHCNIYDGHKLCCTSEMYAPVNLVQAAENKKCRFRHSPSKHVQFCEERKYLDCDKHEFTDNCTRIEKCLNHPNTSSGNFQCFLNPPPFKLEESNVYCYSDNCVNCNLCTLETTGACHTENFDSSTSLCATSESEICLNVDHDYEETETSYIKTIVKSTDSPEFVAFLKTVSLTGEKEVDDEIVDFYRNKFSV